MRTSHYPVVDWYVACGMIAVVAWTVLAALVGLGWLLWSQWQSPLVIGRALETAHPRFLLWRLTLFGVLIGFWPVRAHLISGWRRLADAQNARLVGARWTIAIWLVVLELGLHHRAGRIAHGLKGSRIEEPTR